MNRQTEIIELLTKSLDDSVTFFQSLTPVQLELQVYQDGARWTAKQVVAHFVTIERSMQKLFNNILSGGQGAPADFDVDRYNKSKVAKLDGTALDELIVQFRAVRRETINIVDRMSDSDFDREGYHAFHGHGRLEHFIRWTYEHAGLHEDDIRKAMQ